ncbi:DUF6779 domain-containing protein [Geodermatophilus chilensis]|uniref:DUF6779 domain-containing protein n=1 Tax=Geodermatophilus chilensis TaxID=2035835 RepID=UPI0012FFEA15|nr:DUF6779 domain-containing protein [Geodermatophilus chilensis]
MTAPYGFVGSVIGVYETARDAASAHRDGPAGRPAGPASPGLRTLGLVVGFVLAVVATGVVFLTDDPQLLRLAVVAAAWAFVLAALVASRRPGDPVEHADLGRAAVEREAELRRAHELELQREGTARREHELRLADELRRTVEQSMRAELEALRAELAPVGELRRELAQVAELRHELAEVAGLRRDLAGLAELRTALAGLDLTALAELRTDVARLRSELPEQRSGEMLVERVMLRTQSTRTAPATTEAAAPRTVEADSWTSPAPELTAAWPAVRADEPAAGTRGPDGVRAEPRRVPPPPPPPPLDWLAGRRLVEPDEAAEARRTRHAATAEPPPPPLDWLASRSLLTPPPPPPSPEHEDETEPRRRRTDPPKPTATPVPDDLLTTERPVAQRQRPPVPGPAAPPAEVPAPAPTAEAHAPAAGDPGRRVAELLAESGLTPPSGGRRRRRYREDDESDDVLARVLGR